MLLPIPHPRLGEVPVYEPGRPIEEVARELGLNPRKIIKLASNENALGPSPRALAAARRVLLKAHLYPDGSGFYLRRALAKKWKLAIENVVLGNGSNEIIELLGHAYLSPGDEVVVSEHAFAVYDIVAKLFGAKIVLAPEKRFCHDLDAMRARITQRTKMIFITNPNNPTGTMVGAREIERFMARVPPRVLVVFDEAYYEFLDRPPDTLRWVRDGRPVALLRTFSKIAGLAALRIGYGLMPAEIASWLQRVRQPFNVNALAQAAAQAALKDSAHIRRTRTMTKQGRRYLERQFAQLGLDYVSSGANFVMVRVGDGNAVFQRLLRRGVIVRPLANYRLPEWIRVTVGTMPQNRAFLAALSEVLRSE